MGERERREVWIEGRGTGEREWEEGEKGREERRKGKSEVREENGERKVKEERPGADTGFVKGGSRYITHCRRQCIEVCSAD